MPVIHRVVVNGEEVAIQGEIDGFRDALVQAVRAGGALVPLAVGPRRQIEVLVTAATTVVIETMDVPDDSDDPGEPIGDFDLEWWLPER